MKRDSRGRITLDIIEFICLVAIGFAGVGLLIWSSANDRPECPDPSGAAPGAIEIDSVLQSEAITGSKGENVPRSSLDENGNSGYPLNPSGAGSIDMAPDQNESPERDVEIFLGDFSQVLSQSNGDATAVESTLKQEETVGEFTIQIYEPTYENSFLLQEVMDFVLVRILKTGELLEEFVMFKYTFVDEKSGTDLNRDGLADLALISWYGGSSGHNDVSVYSLNDTIDPVWFGEQKKFVEWRDIDGDGLYEMIDTAYAFTSFPNSSDDFNLVYAYVEGEGWTREASGDFPAYYQEMVKEYDADISDNIGPGTFPEYIAALILLGRAEEAWNNIRDLPDSKSMTVQELWIEVTSFLAKYGYHDLFKGVGPQIPEAPQLEEQ